MSLRNVIKDFEAVFLPTVREEFITHETLIRAVAEQIGSAHEDEGVDPDIARLSRISILGSPPFAKIMKFDAELSLQIGERVLDSAESTNNHRRKERMSGDSAAGELTVYFRAAGADDVTIGEFPVFAYRSEISEAEIKCSIGSRKVNFEIIKRHTPVVTLEAEHPPDWGSHSNAIFAFSYSSAERKARVITDNRADQSVDCDAGWLDARELKQQYLDIAQSPYNLQEGGLYSRLLSLQECRQLLEISPELREPGDSTRFDGPFPD